MGRISGNENSFPTIKQVNDALSGGGTLDISEYVNELFELADTKETDDYASLNSPTLIEMISEIIDNKPNILTGKGYYNNDINFTTSNIDWCEITINDDYVKQYIVSFKIYIIAYGAVYNFVFFKMVEAYFYSKFILQANSFLNKRI